MSDKGMGIGNIVAPALGAGLGLVLGEYNDKRQREQQEKLQKIQIRGQKEMTDYNAGTQLDMWNKTNYEAQVEHMKKAGLNPALMYGNGGGGGSTTGSPSGSVTGGNAPTGGKEIQEGLGLAMQMKAQTELLQAQKENIEADTANKTAGTEGKALENKFEQWLQSEQEDGMSVKERGVRLEQNKTMADIMNLGEKVNEIKANVKGIDAGTEVKKQETALKKQAWDMLEKMNPLELDKMKKETELYLNDPNNTEGAQWAKMIMGMIGALTGIGGTINTIKNAGKAIESTTNHGNGKTSTTYTRKIK